MATIITIRVDALEGRIHSLTCLLGCSDSSSAVGWMHRTNFNPIKKTCSQRLLPPPFSTTHALQCQLLPPTPTGATQHYSRHSISLAFPHHHRTHHFSLSHLKFPATETISDLPSSTRDRLMGYLYAADIERCKGITEDNHKKYKRAWKQWVSWLALVGLEGDPCLLRFEGAERVRLIEGFTVRIRNGEQSPPGHKRPLVSGTADCTLCNLASSFTVNDHSNPRRNDDGDIHPHLKIILRAYSHADLKTKAQKPITPMLLAYLYTRKKNNTFAQLIADLCNGAFLFACWLCKYSQTKGT